MTETPTVVITGTGSCTGAGPDNDSFAGALAEGRGAFGPLPAPLDLLPPGFGGVATTDRSLPRKLPGGRALRPSTMTRYTFLSTIGLGLVLQDAGIDPEPEDAQAVRRSLFAGSYVNLPEMAKYVGMAHLCRERGASADGRYEVDDAKVMQGMKRFTGFEFLRLMNNMPVAHGAIQARCKGPCNTYMGFCQAGLQAVGAGLRHIQDGLTDTALCGGAGSAVIEHALMYKAYRGLLSQEKDPTAACRPFDRRASGLVPGEGAGYVALETADAAASRGARILGTLRGYATGFAPPTSRRGLPASSAGLVSTLKAALDDAGLEPGQVDLLVPTGHGVAALDALELDAYRQVFGAHLAHMQVLLHTPVTGFTEAAHGALGLNAALQALNAQAPVVGWRPGEAIDGFPATPPRSGTPRRALVAAFAMEGSSAAVVVDGPA